MQDISIIKACESFDCVGVMWIRTIGQLISCSVLAFKEDVEGLVLLGVIGM
jgi:hypothetical protein